MTCEYSLVIPSAGVVPDDLAAEFGRIETALIPLGGVSSFLRVAQCHPNASIVLVAGRELDGPLAQAIRQAEDPKIHYVCVGETESLGQTVERALESVEMSRPVVIQFADTIVDASPDREGDWFMVAQVSEGFRWTTCSVGADGRPHSILDRYVAKPDADGLVAFVGVFRFASPSRLRSALARNPSARFYDAIAEYYSASPSARALYVREWHDVGHLDTYHRARRRLYLSPREFNSTIVDETRGVLVKTSLRGSKLIDEMRWYRDLPPRLQYLVPRVFSADDREELPRLELEYYGYPPLSEVFLHGSLDAGEWGNIMSVVRRAIDALASERGPWLQEEDLRTIYLEKTIARLGDVDLESLVGAAAGDSVSVNGVDVGALVSLRSRLESVGERSGLFRPRRSVCMHGDPCFSNILYDRRSGQVKLIDPRGAFSTPGVWGDGLYDVAKLRHSLWGAYDSLLACRGSLTKNGHDWILTLNEPFVAERLRAIVDRWSWGGENALKFSDFPVRVAEAALFLSMTPLHRDRPDAQRRFLLRGMELLTAVERQFP